MRVKESHYDFDTVIDRSGTYALKWDIPDGELPMWVADMDFQTAPEIIAAMQKRVSHGVFGYSIVPDEWYQSYIGWWKRRHDFTIEKDWLIFCTGVVPAISSIVRKLTTPGENVLIQTPVYNIFFNSIVNNGRNVVESPLQYDGKEYRMDFDELEAKLSDPQTTLMILCNPHNPVGKIWDRETLGHIGMLCKLHHVTVIADEIHCDLTDPGLSYTPFASASKTCRDISITCIAPTKSFNLAGIQTAAVVVPDDHLRHKVWRGLNTDEVAEPNSFAIAAAIAAFEQGEPWLEELREYLYRNKQLAADFLKEQLPQVKLLDSKATYLLWLDCTEFCQDSQKLQDFLREKAGLFLSLGAIYGSNGEGFLRMNIACPHAMVEEGLKRLKKITDFSAVQPCDFLVE